MSERVPDIYPVLSYKDARAGLDFLKNTLGFESLAEHSNEDGEVYHAELRYGDGIIMVSGNRQPDSANPWSEAKFGTYVVVDDVDAHYKRAKAAGAEILMEPFDTEYGSRDYSVRDAEGHYWSFGTYRPSV
jgi:uncharacterized glyoxalase superfamily protein PhnB